MSQTFIMRPMDDLLSEPTVNMERDYTPSTFQAARGKMSIMPPADYNLAIEASRKAWQSTGTLQDFTSAHTYLDGYTSDEEVASPIDSEEPGFDSAGSEVDSTPSIKQSPSLESLPQDYHAVQVCSEAQAVQFVPAGRPKVVTLNKSAQTSSSAILQRSSTRVAGSQLPPAAQPSPDWPLRTPSTQVGRRPNNLRRKRVIPTLRGLPGVDSLEPSNTKTRMPQTPLTARRASPPPPARTLHKLSSSFSLRRLGRSRRQDSVSSSSTIDQDPRLNTPSPTTEFPASPSVRSPVRSATVRATPKMVARGADERAPPLVLPPCPDGYNVGVSLEELFHWPARNDSKATPAVSDQPESTPKRIRRRTLSAAYVTAEA